MRQFLALALLFGTFYIAPIKGAVGFHEHQTDSGTVLNIKDTLTLAQHFSKGHVKGHLRNFFMSTINNGALKDYWTNASGMSLHYESLPMYGFVFEIKGIFTFQTLSSDLNKKDDVVGANSRWEIELYDILDRENKRDLDRLEELFLEYRWRNSFVKYGRIAIDDTPIVNERDSRMKPFAVKGFYGSIDLGHGLVFKPLFINGASPRSTVEWFSMEEAIGLTNNGVDANGDTANYQHHLKADFLMGFGVQYSKNNFAFEFWDFLLDDAFNLSWLQGGYADESWEFGLIGIYQQGLPQQKTFELNQQYFQVGTQTGAISTMFKRKMKRFYVSAARTDIFGSGRFLTPRELGREEFFTSMARSRADGLGRAAINKATLGYTNNNKGRLNAELSMQYTKTAGENNYQFNKYRVRDYLQYNLDIDYHFSGKLQGLEAQLLYIYRQDVANNTITPLQEFNNTNFHQINFIVNVNF